MKWAIGSQVPTLEDKLIECRYAVHRLDGDRASVKDSSVSREVLRYSQPVWETILKQQDVYLN